jgi:hypothetical protein
MVIELQNVAENQQFGKFDTKLGPFETEKVLRSTTLMPVSKMARLVSRSIKLGTARWMAIKNPENRGLETKLPIVTAS